MDERDVRTMPDDSEFERLFAALDDVKASEELKATTMSAVFAQLDDEDEAPEETVEQTARLSRFRVIEGGGAGQTAELVEKTEALPTALEQDTVEQPLLEEGRRTGAASARPRKKGLRLRIAAALLVVALGLGGGAAYALPASHVLATAGDTTFDLGVNVFGITVSASADSEDGKAVLDQVKVQNVGFREAFDSLLAAYEQHKGDEAEAVSVKVDGSFAGSKDRLAGEAGTIVNEHAQKRREGAAASGTGGGTAVQESPAASESSGQPSSGGQTPPPQQQGGGQSAAPSAQEGQQGQTSGGTQQPQAPEESNASDAGDAQGVSGGTDQAEGDAQGEAPAAGPSDGGAQAAPSGGGEQAGGEAPGK